MNNTTAFLITVCLTIFLLSCARHTAVRPPLHTESVGVLVMAHGGSPVWNAAVEESVAPLRSSVPVAVAFGMADRETLQRAVEELESQGVGRIGVVRVFVSENSFDH